MNKRKLLSSSILGLVSALCLVGCDNGTHVAPNYSSYAETNVMGISGWVSPAPGNWNGHTNPDRITDEGYAQIVECGLNSIYALYEHVNSDWTAKAAQLATKYGIKYYARDSVNIVGDPIEDGLEPGEIIERPYVQKYCNEPGFAGHLAKDEPSARDFTWLGHLKEYYDAEFPGKEFYVNLFPAYANISQLGVSTYEQYVSQYIDKVSPDFVSYDCYSLDEDAYGHVKIKSASLYNRKVVAEICSANGLPYGNFTATLKFGDASSSRTIKKESELRWQIMTDFAYGCSRVQYFCYSTPIEWEPVSQHALVDSNGNATPTFNFAKNINNTVKLWDEAYLNYAWKKTMLVDGSESASINASFDMVRDTSPTSLPGISKVSANLDTLVGQFDSKVDGNKGYMITNYAEPSVDANVDNVKVTFDKKYAKALVYDNTSVKEVSLDKGVLKHTLNPGDGIFVIPF